MKVVITMAALFVVTVGVIMALSANSKSNKIEARDSITRAEEALNSSAIAYEPRILEAEKLVNATTKGAMTQPANHFLQRYFASVRTARITGSKEDMHIVHACKDDLDDSLGEHVLWDIEADVYKISKGDCDKLWEASVDAIVKGNSEGMKNLTLHKAKSKK